MGIAQDGCNIFTSKPDINITFPSFGSSVGVLPTLDAEDSNVRVFLNLCGTWSYTVSQGLKYPREVATSTPLNHGSPSTARHSTVKNRSFEGFRFVSFYLVYIRIYGIPLNKF